MARKTIAQTIIEEQEAEGKTYLGATSGWLSFRKGSNLSRKLDALGLTENDVDVYQGAKKRHQSEGAALLIFSRK